MTSAKPKISNPRHRPALARFAAIGSAWVFVLVTLGAFTTSIGAGMAFPDWPLSNGSVNPDGWLTDVAMFAEHSHRLSGTVMGMITIVLTLWIWRAEERRWLKKLGWLALGIVVFQGLLGGKRVLLDSIAVPGFEMSLGQMLRIPHGVLAQVFVCVLFAIAGALSRSWCEAEPREVSAKVRGWALALVALLFVQLTIAATMRHNFAGLAIPTFPLTPEGGLLPEVWNFPVAIHFAHRLFALLITVCVVGLLVAVFRSEKSTQRDRFGALLIAGLLVLQGTLGAFTIWTMRGPYVTTAHVCVGALFLAVSFAFAWRLHRDRIESRP